MHVRVLRLCLGKFPRAKLKNRISHMLSYGLLGTNRFYPAKGIVRLATETVDGKKLVILSAVPEDQIDESTNNSHNYNSEDGPTPPWESDNKGDGLHC